MGKKRPRQAERHVLQDYASELDRGCSDKFVNDSVLKSNGEYARDCKLLHFYIINLRP